MVFLHEHENVNILQQPATHGAAVSTYTLKYAHSNNISSMCTRDFFLFTFFFISFAAAGCIFEIEDANTVAVRVFVFSPLSS